ncbi:MAG TPA: efflux RND transporter periplasmic adaptor subunit, partial [Dongiaceae bacterium]
MKLPLASYVLLAALWLGCHKENGEKTGRSADDAVPVTIAAVALVPLDLTLPVVGTLFARDEATLGAEVEGSVEKTMAEFGDRVRAGQEIAQIDTTTYQALARQAAANLSRTRAAAANAEANLKRFQELRKENIASPSDLDKATAEAEQARAEVKAAEAAEAIARLNLQRSH